MLPRQFYVPGGPGPRRLRRRGGGGWGGGGFGVTSMGRAQKRGEVVYTAATVLGRYDAAVRDAE
ncbi:hypothetical protein, partial [Nocardia brasiliensis]|uniref:hypothetical protein n=1 Tax=Nocardia brasiliensis TaxID=37326 RepID=UPI002454A5F7